MFPNLEASIYEILATIGVFAGGLALWFMAGKKWVGIGLMVASFAWAWIRFIQPLINS